MPVVTPEKLVKLQQKGDGIRNICILAHVDHGKTSLTDALIATNGIISPKLAGKIRYLDSRPDEQLRGITMESSAISLYFSLMRRSAPEAQPEQAEYLINLIDSPGHIDFSSEVSTASRLCDGAVVLVDAVEGVCSQTVTVLRQTWVEKLKPLLVINKMDRLITELKLSPGEAYTHLSKLLEQVNAVMGSFALGERMEDDLRWRERIDEKVNATKGQESVDGASKARKNSIAQDEEGIVISDAPAEYEEKDDEDIYFEPEKNNVIFSSAIDGWAFTPRQFAGLYEKKLGIKRHVLEKVLWGDFYLDPKTKRVLSSKHLKGRSLKPMFVQLVLDNIWAVYEATMGGPNNKGDSTLLEKITKSLNINIPAHVLRSRDPKALLSAVFGAWLPLSTALLVSVTQNLPSPQSAQEARMPSLLEASPGSSHIDERVTKATVHSKQTIGEPVLAYVSKMVSIPESELPANKRRGGMLSAEEARELGRKKRAEIARAQAQANGESDVASVSDALSSVAIGEEEDLNATNGEDAQADDPEHLIGFARLFSGTLTVGDEVYVLPPKFSPARPHQQPQPKKVTITALYLLMGRSLETLNSVPAGNVVGIGGLDGAILKNGTICSQLEGAPNLSSTTTISTNAPIVRVALEPAFPGDLDKMVRGLRLLEQADPAVTYEQLESGEHVILTAGELHLERCLKDLRERFAKCDIQAGEAIVPYREGIVRGEEMNPPKNVELGRGRVQIETTSKQVTLRLSVRPLPAPVTEFLVRHTGAVKRLYSERKAQEEERQAPSDEQVNGDQSEMLEEQDMEAEDTAAEAGQILTLAEFKQRLTEAFEEEKTDKELWKGVVEKICSFGPRRVGPNLLIDTTEKAVCGRFLEENDDSDNATNGIDKDSSTLADKVAYAFQLATYNGPLCAEPMQGVAVFVEDICTNVSEDEASQNMGRLTGEIIRTAREAIRQGFLDWSPRILLAMYSCEIQASAEVLGRVYSVITRRRGRIVNESLLEPSTNFTILALLPVAESFGFSDEIRQRTSGFAAPQLVFEGFEMLDEDPFWVPTTEEELEDLGELSDRANVAKRYVDRVRERKGLTVKRKVVESAEKQKTLKRNGKILYHVDRHGFDKPSAWADGDTSRCYGWRYTEAVGDKVLDGRGLVDEILRSVMRFSYSIAAFSLLSSSSAGRQPPLLTNVTVFDPPDTYTVPRTLYARVRALECAKKDVLLATWENYLPTDTPEEPCPDNCPENPYIPIYQSYDQGKTWSERSKVYDTVNGWGLRYQPELHEMTEDVGEYPAGTLLLAANSIPADLSETKIDVYSSTDEGYTWSFVSSVARGGVALPENQYTPVWEPFILSYNGEIVLYYSDQREPEGQNNTLGQKMVHQTTSDLLNWGPIVDDIHYDNATWRPGMPTVSELPSGDWIMTYEFYGAVEADFAVYYRISESPLTFDDKLGIPLLPADGTIPVGSPYNVWTPAGGPQGTIVVSDGNNRELYLNKKLGDPDAWTTLQTPAGSSYTRSLLVLPNDPSRIMIAAGGVLGGENNSVLVATIDIDGGHKYPKRYGRGKKGGKCKAKGYGQ